MAITEFECQGYEKLALRDIKYVSMTPVQKLQAILGTNGSGKTSLMEELSPLASKPDGYKIDGVRNGFKRIVIQRKGHTYECLSDFRGVKNRYMISKDSEVLYEGHSSIAYQDLVKQELGITPELHAIRIGTQRFTTMDVASRRAWFTKLSPEDYSYAIGYYKRLGDATRDITGTIKRINTKLMQEKAKLIDPDKEKSIRSEIQELIKNKNSMMQHWRPMETSVEEALDQIQDIDTQLESMCNEFTKSLKVFCNVKGYTSQQDIWTEIAEVQGKLSYTRTVIDQICEEIEGNRSILSQAQLAMDKDIVAITQELSSVSRELINLKLVIFVPDWLETPKEALVAYESVTPELLPIMDELLEDPKLDLYTVERHQENSAQLAQLSKSIEGMELIKKKLQDQIETLEHRREEGHTECPKCAHTWSRGFSEALYQELLIKSARASDEIATSTAKYQELHEHLQTSTYQLQLFNQINLLARAYPILSPMWDGLNGHRFIRTTPKSAIEYVKATKTQMEYSKSYKELLEQRDALTTQKEAALASSGINQQELLEKNNSLESKLYIYQQDQSYQTTLLEGLKKAQQAMQYQEQYLPLAENLMMHRSDLINKAEVANHHAAINSIMMYFDSEVTQRERLLTQIDSQHRLIQVLEAEVEDGYTKEALMKKALAVLSPAEGLIAKGLTGFINHFIAMMNAVIEKVWLYPLSIDPITISEEHGVDLDYKFPFHVDNKPAGQDVSQASGAQKEIFDLAFMLVSMVQLGMDDTEIFLDEFSIKMDYAHRREAMRMIMDLINSSNFSQIFMISHYESSYGSLSEADITVLCPENIQLPPDLKYNVNAKILS